LARTLNDETDKRRAAGSSRAALPFRAFGAAFSRVFGNFTLSLAANVSAVLLSIPLLLLVGAGAFAAHSYLLIPLGLVILLGILPSPTTCGLHFAASELARGDMMALSDIRTGLRGYWRSALLTWLVSLVFTMLILVNLAFYAGQIRSAHSPLHAVAGPATALWTIALVLWIAMHLYVFPLLLVQDDNRLRTTYRNALVIVASRPFFTLIVLVVWLVVLTFTAFTGLSSVIGLALGAAIQHNALVRLLPGFTTTQAAGRRESYSRRG
jgi:hypothetical protein